jgi:hypothetical protein
MVCLIDDLERAGYVKRERNPDDRRACVTTLTAAGKWMQARGEEAVDAHALQYFGQLSEASGRSSTDCLHASSKHRSRQERHAFLAAGRTWRPFRRCAMMRP